MIGDTQLSYRLSRWTLLILLLSAIPLVCLPVRAEEQETPATTTPAPSDSGAAADLVDTPTGKVGEAANETELLAGNRPDRLFLVAVVWHRGPSDLESTPTAWLSDQDRGKTAILEKGTAFRVGDTPATVEGIEKDSLLLKIHDECRKWKLGKSFAAVLNDKTEPRGLAENIPTEAPATDKAANDGKRRSSVHIKLLPGIGLILRGNKKDVKRMTDWIRQIEQRGLKPAASDKNDEKAGQTQQTRQIMVYQFDGLDLDPQSVLSLLRALLAEGPEVRMEVDLKTDSLFVWASPSVHATIREILKLFPRRDAESLHKPSSHATIRDFLEVFPLQAGQKPMPDAAKPQATDAKRNDERKLRFAFRYQKWSDVLEWYAEQAGLSLVADSSIPGTFNYSDNKAYTVMEAMDLLNSVLSAKGYALVRRDRMLLVVNAADGIPTDLVPRLTIETLGDRGRFELVSVMFPLGRRDAEVVRNEVSRQLSPCGSTVVLPQTHQILVIDRAGIMRTINAIINSVPEPAP